MLPPASHPSIPPLFIFGCGFKQQGSWKVSTRYSYLGCDVAAGGGGNGAGFGGGYGTPTGYGGGAVGGGAVRGGGAVAGEIPSWAGPMRSFSFFSSFAVVIWPCDRMTRKMNIPASIIQSARLLEGRAGSEETMMGSSRRGGGAVFGDPFAMGAGGACRDHVGMVNWGPGGRSGGATGVLIPSVRRAGL